MKMELQCLELIDKKVDRIFEPSNYVNSTGEYEDYFNLNPVVRRLRNDVRTSLVSSGDKEKVLLYSLLKNLDENYNIFSRPNIK